MPQDVPSVVKRAVLAPGRQKVLRFNCPEREFALLIILPEEVDQLTCRV